MPEAEKSLRIEVSNPKKSAVFNKVKRNNATNIRVLTKKFYLKNQ